MKIYRYKLYTNGRRGNLHRTITRFGEVRNYAVKMMELAYKHFKKSVTAYDLSNHIAKKKKIVCATATLVEGLDAQAVQECLARVYKGYRTYFSHCKKKRNGEIVEHRRIRKPHEKKPWKNRSFTLLQCGYKFNDTWTKIRILGKWYGFFKSQEIRGKVKRVTVKRDWCGDMWIAVLTDWNEPKEGSRTGEAAGFDFGLKTFLTGSDGTDIRNPQFLKREMRKYRRLSSEFGTKVKGSNNRKKARKERARLLRRINNQRTDWQWKTARKLLSLYDVICLETLSIAGMQRHRNWGRKVSDLAYSDFLNKLDYLASKMGKKVVYIDRFAATSQTCHVCGEKNSAVKDLNVREWTCPHCGTHHDRDRNAAIVILRVGMSTLGRDEIRLLSAREVA